jgi:hypothetical protein
VPSGYPCRIPRILFVKDTTWPKPSVPSSIAGEIGTK